MAGGKKAAAVLRMADSALLGVFKSTRFMARFVPPSFLIALSDACGYVLFYLRRGGRDYLMRTLRESLPDVTDQKELKRIARKAFSAPFRSMLDVILLDRYGDRILDDVKAQEAMKVLIERIDAAQAEGKGMIIYSTHIGGIAIGHCLLARLGRSYPPLVLPPSHTPIPRYLSALIDLIQNLGTDTEHPVFWADKDVIPKVQQQLGQGKRVGLTFDLTGGTIVDFFGRPTAIASGIAHFAYDSGAHILPASILHGKGPLDYVVKSYEPLSYTLNGDRSADVRNILSDVVRVGEEMIREAPEQWMGWFGLRGWRKRAELILEKRGDVR
jgi:Kdo2-lipid IVA lauroyltransferase/acyltransferase